MIDCDGLGCRLAVSCTLKKALKHGEQALFDTLNSYSLADLVTSRKSMVRLLINKAA